MKKQISYNITPEQIAYIQDHTFNMVYDWTLYWLYSDRMKTLLPFLHTNKIRILRDKNPDFLINPYLLFHLVSFIYFLCHSKCCPGFRPS